MPDSPDPQHPYLRRVEIDETPITMHEEPVGGLLGDGAKAIRGALELRLGDESPQELVQQQELGIHASASKRAAVTPIRPST